ncbi:hypothetical protein QJS10_CPA05g00929 [Acorus calamus]|uniref:Uncharacterized protein n=1 Tax=Acorus calamus TaxID=4465 RepID=A0AAV9ERV2_ACOCL|nr:hypothetical protein QJS10_CPA05g00929 [Acorus calamus]
MPHQPSPFLASTSPIIFSFTFFRSSTSDLVFLSLDFHSWPHLLSPIPIFHSRFDRRVFRSSTPDQI